eukprot:7583410-Lingulodinium_polyedra.AAC.1
MSPALLAALKEGLRRRLAAACLWPLRRPGAARRIRPKLPQGLGPRRLQRAQLPQKSHGLR